MSISNEDNGTEGITPFLFGPLPSRRLGMSLGVDIVPYKTCSFNCIYCECGQTATTLIRRKRYFPALEIIAELRKFLKKSPQLDYITFSGGGEPTLSTEIGKIVLFLKKEFPLYKIALLTNASLLSDKAVRKEINGFDLIIPTLSAVSQEVFEKIHRPFKGINVSDIIVGIKKLKTETKSKIWIEIFIVTHLNDNKQELKLFKKTLLEINPDKVCLNTLDRPGTESWVTAVSVKKLTEIKDFFNPLNVEITSGNKSLSGSCLCIDGIEKKILNLLKRRPCTEEDLLVIFSVEKSILNKYLQELENSDKIKKEKKQRGVFYKIK